MNREFLKNPGAASLAVRKGISIKTVSSQLNKLMTDENTEYLPCENGFAYNKSRWKIICSVQHAIEISRGGKEYETCQHNLAAGAGLL